MDEPEWAINLDDFALVKSAFLDGSKHCEEILLYALEDDKGLADQVNDALTKVRLRDPGDRRNSDLRHPITPAEIVVTESSLRLLIRFAKSIQDGLMRVHGRILSNQDNFNLIVQILRNARLRDPKLKGERKEDPPTG